MYSPKIKLPRSTKSCPTDSVSGGGTDREPALLEFYTRAGMAKIAPESPPSAARRVGQVLPSRLPISEQEVWELAGAVTRRLRAK
jgi:hypothetical protein